MAFFGTGNHLPDFHNKSQHKASKKVIKRQRVLNQIDGVLIIN